MDANDKLIEILANYRDAAIGTAALDSTQNNMCVDRLHSCYKILRETDDGRAGIISLISDENPHVRGWAAAHSLEWAPQIAKLALEDLRDSDGPASFSAKWTLKEFSKGRLSFDY